MKRVFPIVIVVLGSWAFCLHAAVHPVPGRCSIVRPVLDSCNSDRTMDVETGAYWRDMCVESGVVVYLAGDTVISGQLEVETGGCIITDGSLTVIAGEGRVINHGCIIAGKVSFSGRDIINTGIIECPGGTVTLDAGIRINQCGTIDTNGVEGNGGDISITAGEAVFLGCHSITVADAGMRGNGGKVTVCSPGTVSFHDSARISAKGGIESGNGGFIELSGRQHVQLQGQIDLTGTTGTDGRLLIDPYNIHIVDEPGSPDEQYGNMFDNRWDPAGNDSRLDIDVLEGYLAVADVTISTEGDGLGSQQGDVTFIAGRPLQDGAGGFSNHSLTIDAAGRISFNEYSGILFGGTGNVTLNAGGDVSINADIWLSGGSFTSTGDEFSSDFAGKIKALGGAVTLSHAGRINISGGIDSGGGDVYMEGDSVELFSTVAAPGGKVNIHASGGSINGALGSGNVDINCDELTLIAYSGIGDTEIIETAVTTLVASVSLGSVSVVERDDIVLTGINVGSGDIEVLTYAGDITIGDVHSSAGDVSITVTAGSIHNNFGTLNADTAYLTASGSIGSGGNEIRTQIATLNADAVDIYISEMDAVTLHTVNASGDLHVGAGNITVGAVSVGGEARLNSGGSISDDNTGTFTASAADLYASDHIGSANNVLDTDIDTLTVETSGGSIHIEQTDNIQIASARAGLDFNLACTADIRVTEFIDAGRDVRIRGSDVELNNSISAGNDITIEGASGSSGTGNVTVGGDANAGGEIVINSPNATYFGGFVIAQGDVTLDIMTAEFNAGGDQTIDAEGGRLVVAGSLTKTNGDLLLRGAADIDLNGDVYVQGGKLEIRSTVDADGDLMAQGRIHLYGFTNNLAGDVVSETGGITFEGDVIADGSRGQKFDAGTGMLIARALVNKVTSGDLILEGDSFTLADGAALILMGDGSLTVQAGNGIVLGGPVTTLMDLTLDAGIGTMWAKDTITTTTGDIHIRGSSIDLGGNVTTAGSIVFNAPRIYLAAAIDSAEIIINSPAATLNLASNLTLNDTLTVDTDLVLGGVAESLALGGLNILDGGSMDIGSLLLHVAGYVETTLDGWIADGRLFSSAAQALDAAYDLMNNRTSVAPASGGLGKFADLNCDGIVDYLDLSILVSQWPGAPGQPSADIVPRKGDGLVNMFDYAKLSADWLKKSARIYDLSMDTDPGWITEGQWSFGQPAGGGGVPNGNPDPSGGYTGNNVYGVNLLGDYDTTTPGGPYYLTAGPFDCSGYYDIKLKFARWLNTDVPDYVKNRIEVSGDGTVWTAVWETTGRQEVTDSDWRILVYDISETADGRKTVYIRWSYEVMQDAYAYSGWNIDDVQLWGNVILPVFDLAEDPGWTMEGQWQFGPPAGAGGDSYGNPDPSEGYSGTNVYGVNLAGDYNVAVGGPYYLTSGPIDCRTYSGIRLKFARWLNADAPAYVAARIEVSGNGADWSTVWEHTGSSAITDGTWQIVEYDISDSADNQETVYLRWSYEVFSDRAYPHSGWNIDDIVLLGRH